MTLILSQTLKKFRFKSIQLFNKFIYLSYFNIRLVLWVIPCKLTDLFTEELSVQIDFINQYYI
jgi:hypothetical protein